MADQIKPGDATLTAAVHEKLVAAATPVAKNYAANYELSHASEIASLEDTIGHMNPAKKDELTAILNANSDVVIPKLAAAFSDGNRLDSFVANPDTILDAAKAFNAAAQITKPQNVTPTAAPKSPVPANQDPIVAFIGSLTKEQQTQFSTFMKNASNNPMLKPAIDKLGQSAGDPVKTQKLLDGIKSQLTENPDLFEKINGAFERHPQVVGKELSDLFENPENSTALKHTLMFDGAEQWLDSKLGKDNFLDKIINWLFIDGGLSHLFGDIKAKMGTYLPGGEKAASAALEGAINTAVPGASIIAPLAGVNFESTSTTDGKSPITGVSGQPSQGGSSQENPSAPQQTQNTQLLQTLATTLRPGQTLKIGSDGSTSVDYPAVAQQQKLATATPAAALN